MLKLQVNIKIEQDDIPGTKALLEQSIPDDSETIIASACVLYKVIIRLRLIVNSPNLLFK